jgi:hypothetical protein
MPEEIREGEREARRRLGIPENAEKVLIFAESSHWDPDWLYTSREYYFLRIRWILDKMIRELLKDPRRVYTIESIFFFKMYWDKNPGKRELLRQMVNRGQIRFSGTGFTQPDATLPGTEAIIRDYLMGQQWLWENGMEAEPRVAYLADDFGFSPELPSILRSLGVEYAAASRIDGLMFPGADYSRPGEYPLPGSTAELLLKELRTTDVVWRAADGSEVVFHVNPKTYGQGDLIAFLGAWRWMGVTIGLPWRTERHVGKRIHSYVESLERYSRTPYIFCPIGFDFNSPISDLPLLLDRYNFLRYPKTGIFVLLASLEDYLDLVSYHREKLPALALDPNPYFMGFYSSRPWLKEGCGRLVEDLLAMEKLFFRAGIDLRQVPELGEKWRRAWERAVVTNHHDFITGTSPKRVFEGEQKPWVEEARRLAGEVLSGAVGFVPLPEEEGAESSVPGWSLEAGVLKVETPYYAVELSEEAGGCITSWIDRRSGREMLAGPANDLVVYHDSGGLWRMGCEYRGGKFELLTKASDHPAAISACEEDGTLAAVVTSGNEECRVTRKMWFLKDSPLIWMRTVGMAGDYRTITCRFVTRLEGECWSMDVPGGVVDRSLSKIYDPTFWSAQSFAHYRGKGDEGGVAIFSSRPFAISGRESGEVEWVVVRNAPKERAFGWLPLFAHPAKGPDPSAQVLDYAVGVIGPGDWRENKLHFVVNKLARTPWRDYRDEAVMREAEKAVVVDHEDVRVLAVKPASRGEGTIVRLFSYSGGEVTVRLRVSGGEIESATLCDARERDLADMAELSLEDGAVVVPLKGNITSVRLRVKCR